MRRKHLALLLAPLGFLIVEAALAAKSSGSPLQKLFDATWQEDLADDPLSATQLGDPRYNDKWPDMSQISIDARQKKNYSRLQSLAKINRDKLTKDEQLTLERGQTVRSGHGARRQLPHTPDPCRTFVRCPTGDELPIVGFERRVSLRRSTVQGKPVARRGRKARDLPRETARLPGADDLDRLGRSRM